MTALLFDATTDGPLWAAALGCIIVFMGLIAAARWRAEDQRERDRKRRQREYARLAVDAELYRYDLEDGRT